MDNTGKFFLGLLGGGLLLMAVKNKKTIKTSALSLIKQFEGFRDKAYKDAVGVWTIGYGTTTNVKPGDTVTQAQAEAFLKRDAKQFADTIVNNVKVPLTNNQFAALLSLVYNIGGNAFQKSTLLKKINAGAGANEIEPHFLAWRNAGGKPILLKRRQQEFEIYKS